MVKKETFQLEVQLLNMAAEKILTNFGLDFSGSKLKDLNGALINSSNESGHKLPDKFTELLINNKLNENQLDALLKNLTVGETYFFRDEKLFNALQNSQIKDFFQKKNNINIWSAGCASGEEPYSIAILIDKIYGNNSDIKFNIFASDINKHAIEKAKKGLYRDWSFRSTPKWVKTNYFSQVEDGLFEIDDCVKKKVEFDILNLSDIDTIKNSHARYDIIICRNVLIYFSKPVSKNLLDAFYHKLNIDGLYITTASESLNVDKNLFAKFMDGNNAIFKKNNLKLPHSISIPEKKSAVKKQQTPVKRNIPAKKDSKITNETNAADSIRNYKKAVREYNNKQFSKSHILFHEIMSEVKSGKMKVEDEAELFFYLIKTFMKLGNYEDAQNLCDSALKKFNLDYRMHYLHGILLHDKGEFIEAEKALNRSIYLNNKFPLSFFELANLQLSSGKSSYRRNFQNAVKMLLEINKDEIVIYSDGISAGDLLKQITQHID